MSNFKQRGELNVDRLSSFFYREGRLEIEKISIIKNNVIYIETMDRERFILKKHRNINNVGQQWKFFESIKATMIVPFARFPNGRKIIHDGNFVWTITPYIRGRKLNYKSEDDRTAAVATLQRFHESAKSIHVRHPIRKKLFFLRWYDRLLSFEDTEHMFNYYGFENLYTDIVHVMKLSLKQIASHPWKKDEIMAMELGLWVHGDVASHNFIKRSRTYLIDFDLLDCTPQIYDYIQLGQRFLPYINWDLEQLVNYNMVQDHDLEKWLMAIVIPSDVIREWMYFLSKHPSASPKTYLVEMEKEWVKRKTFLKSVQSMLKSF